MLECRRSARVLLVEDDDEDALLIEGALCRAEGSEYALERVRSCDEACARIGSESFDAIVVDLGLPDARGLEAISRLRDVADSLPILVTTGLDDLDAETAALASGAQEYLVKGESQASMLRRLLRHTMERQRLLDQLREAHRSENRQKEEFFSQISHELRTPLSAVFQFVGLLRDEVAAPLSGDQAEFLEIIQRNVEQLRDMISDIMEVSRGASGKLSVTPGCLDVGALVDEVVESFRPTADEAGIRLAARVDAAGRTALADPVRVRQVLHNLISNALKFTPREGEIEVAVGEHEDGVRVSVRDTGCGIPEESGARIFDRLGQVDGDRDQKRGGLGLGLYICKHIVDRHHGRIWVESELGKGSTFHFTLPEFALSELVGRLLAEDVGQLAVVSIGLLGPPVARLEVDRFLDTVQARALRDSDVIVPPLADASRIFVIAPTGEQGATAIARRIAGLREDHPTLLPASTRLTLEWCVLHVPADEPHAVLDELESRIAPGLG